MPDTPAAAEATEAPTKNRERQAGRARSESTQTKRMDSQRPGEKWTPAIVPCVGPCLNLVFQVGIPQTL